MGPGYLRELEGVVYRHAAASLRLSPFESSPPRIHAASSGSNSNSNEDDDDPSSRTSTPITTAATAQAQEPLPPPPVALLVSESAFTRNCLLAAHASPLPFLLVHLPSQSSNSSSSSSSSAIGAVFGNPALVSAKGVLGGELEIRWEHGGSVPLSASSLSSSSSSGVLGSGCPRLWWQGQPLPSWTPDADGVVLDQR